MTCREKPRLNIPDVLTLSSREGLLNALEHTDIWKIPIIVMILGMNRDVIDAGTEKFPKKRIRL